MSDYQSLLNNLPSDWETKSIAELGTVVSGGTPSRAVTSFWQGDIPWLTPGEVSKHKSKYMQSTSEYITDAGLNNSGANLIPEGSLLVTSRATLGARVINQLPMTTNQGFKSIVFKDPKDAEYYFHFFSLLKAELERRASGTTFLEISGTEFSEIDLPIPPPKERDKINEVLDTLDTQIRETEAIIAKLQKVKQGLLHDLLTRGVDKSGGLRPCYEDAPELYQPSELGWIPKEWDVVSVGREIKIKHGFAFDGSLFTSNPVGYPLLVPGNFHRNGKLYFTESNTKYFDGKYSDEYLLQPGDMVVVMTDLSPQTLILGRAAVLDKSQWLLHNQRIGKIEFLNEEDWDKHFFVETLSQESIRREVIITATGTTVRHTSPDRIYDLNIAKPPKDEQIEIDKIIQDAWERLEQEVLLLKKLELKKSGLMDDLLTGKIRVTELLK